MVMQYMLLDVTKSEVPTKNFKIAVISNCSSKVEQKKMQCILYFSVYLAKQYMRFTFFDITKFISCTENLFQMTVKMVAKIQQMK